MSLREIARRTGVNRKTVTRYVREYEAMVQSDPEEGVDMCLASKPKYPRRRAERSKLTEPVCAEIEYWLAENARRRQTGMRKQCLKRQDIHRALLEKGFDVSYSSVCKYIQERKAEKSGKPKDVFVKQWYEPGQECEFDWGEVKLRIGGRPVTLPWRCSPSATARGGGPTCSATRTTWPSWSRTATSSTTCTGCRTPWCTTT